MNRKDFKGNVWRELCARAVEKNGGYSSGYHDRAALEWNVCINAWVPELDDELIAKALASDYGSHISADDLDPELIEELKEDGWDEKGRNQLWDLIREDMCETVTGSDTYTQVRPEIAARYGLPGSEHVMPLAYKRRTTEGAYYPAGKDGWMKVNPYSNTLNFSVGWTFHGRQGKHLCLTEFEGRDLNESSDALADNIRNDSEDSDGYYTNDWCQKLLAFIHECDLMFTSQTVKDEFEYQMLFRLAEDLDQVRSETLRKREEAIERQYWAERDVLTKET